MRLDGHYVAVVDRFEDGQGVLLVENDGEVVDEHLVAPEDLPEDARHQDAVLEIMLDSGNVRNLSYLPDETEERQKTAQNRFDRLSQRPDPVDDRSDAPGNAGPSSGADDDDDAGTDTDTGDDADDDVDDS